MENTTWSEQLIRMIMPLKELLKVLWDFIIQWNHHIECRKTEIILLEKEEKKCLIIDIAIPDNNVGLKKKDKIQKYNDLKREIKELWSVKKVDVVPVGYTGALGAVSNKLKQWIDKLGIKLEIEYL